MSRGDAATCPRDTSSHDTVFETDRLLVRPWTVDDVEAAFAIFGDPEVMRYVGDTGEPHPDIDYTRERLRVRNEQVGGLRSGLGNWAVVEKRPARSSAAEDWRCWRTWIDVEVFYHFRKASWGHGYATELTRGSDRTTDSRISIVPG